jgi:hypothetical protein
MCAVPAVRLFVWWQAKAFDVEDCEVGVVNVSISTALTGVGTMVEREMETVLQRLLRSAIKLEVRLRSCCLHRSLRVRRLLLGVLIL